MRVNYTFTCILYKNTYIKRTRERSLSLPGPDFVFDWAPLVREVVLFNGEVLNYTYVLHCIISVIMAKEDFLFDATPR